MATPLLIWGSALSEDVTSVDLEYEDGTVSNLGVTRVTSPIDAAFFLYELPKGHEKEGKGPISVVARGADGKLLARTAILYGAMLSGRLPSK